MLIPYVASSESDKLKFSGFKLCGTKFRLLHGCVEIVTAVSGFIHLPGFPPSPKRQETLSIEGGIMAVEEDSVQLPPELDKLTNLVEERIENFAIGDKDLQDAALGAAKYIFDLSEFTVCEFSGEHSRS